MNTFIYGVFVSHGGLGERRLMGVMNWERCGRRGYWLSFTYCPGVHIDGLRQVIKFFNQESTCSERYSNHSRTEYTLKALPPVLASSVTLIQISVWKRIVKFIQWPQSECLSSLGKQSKVKKVNLRWGLWGCEMLRIPYCPDSRLTVNCEILATCSSTYSPVRTSQEAHSISIK
jgi:hypothetical protein